MNNKLYLLLILIIIPTYMKYIESPEIFSNDSERPIFLAGGITNCPDWQFEIMNLLKEANITLLNPRRKNFPIDDPNAAKEQIKWEFEHLKKAIAILFWFPKESICPIALYELGAWNVSEKPIFIGVHPEYERIIDIEVQTALVRPNLKIVYSLYKLANQVLNYIG